MCGEPVSITSELKTVKASKNLMLNIELLLFQCDVADTECRAKGCYVIVCFSVSRIMETTKAADIDLNELRIKKMFCCISPSYPFTCTCIQSSVWKWQAVNMKC